MIRRVFRFLGIPIFSIDTIEYELEGDEEESSLEISGGSGGSFERAQEFVDERYLPWDEDKGFGFRGPR